MCDCVGNPELEHVIKPEPLPTRIHFEEHELPSDSLNHVDSCECEMERIHYAEQFFGHDLGKRNRKVRKLWIICVAPIDQRRGVRLRIDGGAEYFPTN